MYFTWKHENQFTFKMPLMATVPLFNISVGTDALKGTYTLKVEEIVLKASPKSGRGFFGVFFGECQIKP